MAVCTKLVLFAIFAGVLTMVTLSSGQKLTNCCTKVSVANLTDPIIGFRYQRKRLPCVRAVIFETTGGEVCSHWKQDWVIAKIAELNERLRAMRNSTVTAR